MQKGNVDQKNPGSIAGPPCGFFGRSRAAELGLESSAQLPENLFTGGRGGQHVALTTWPNEDDVVTLKTDVFLATRCSYSMNEEVYGISDVCQLLTFR